MNRSALLLVALLWAGCDLVASSYRAGNVRFTAHKTSYALGDTVMATLENGSNQTVTYNLCLSQLERKEDDEWVSAGPHIMCPLIAYLLQPGEKAPYSLALEDSLDLSQGEYQLTTHVEIEGENVPLATQVFNIKHSN